MQFLCKPTIMALETVRERSGHPTRRSHVPEGWRGGHDRTATERQAHRVGAARASVRPIALVDPRLLGFDVELLLWLRVDLAQLERVAAALSSRREVRYVSATSGYSDLVCEVIVRSPNDLYAFLTTVVGALDGVRQVDGASELVTVKRSHIRLHR